jgi:hypothetical protein
VPLGEAANIVAFAVNVHYDNRDSTPGIVSRDGMRLYYTPTIRPEHTGAVSVMAISTNNQMRIPAGKPRWFVTRSCTLRIRNYFNESPSMTHLFGMSYHAHLLGREMYNEITFRNGTTIHIGSRSIWHFDDQTLHNLLPYNISLETGDHIQSTCVFDSTSRSADTEMGVETVDEMCWATFRSWPLFSIATCDGPVWMGELGPDESALGIASRHPPENAGNDNIFDGTNLLTGGFRIQRRERLVPNSTIYDAQDPIRCRGSRRCGRETSGVKAKTASGVVASLLSLAFMLTYQSRS